MCPWDMGLVLLACGGSGGVDTRHVPATFLGVQKNCTRNRNSPDCRYDFSVPISYPLRVYPLWVVIRQR